jgi:DNA-binding XRE family transcriptional regulator
MDFPTKVRVLRAIKKWSQKELAEKINVSWETISAWENAKRSPHYIAAQKIEKLVKEAMNEVDIK